VSTTEILVNLFHRQGSGISTVRPWVSTTIFRFLGMKLNPHQLRSSMATHAYSRAMQSQLPLSVAPCTRSWTLEERKNAPSHIQLHPSPAMVTQAIASGLGSSTRTVQRLVVQTSMLCYICCIAISGSCADHARKRVQVIHPC
jgi:hypothetical protein